MCCCHIFGNENGGLFSNGAGAIRDALDEAGFTNVGIMAAWLSDLWDGSRKGGLKDAMVGHVGPLKTSGAHGTQSWFFCS